MGTKPFREPVPAVSRDRDPIREPVPAVSRDRDPTFGVATNPTPRVRSVERVSAEITTSGTLLGASIPCVYGHRRVTCDNFLLDKIAGNRIHGAWAICHGELGSITEERANGRVLTGSLKPAWIDTLVSKTGANSQAASSVLNNRQFGDASVDNRHQETYPGVAYLSALMIWIPGADDNLSGSLDITVETTGRKVYDFRDDTWKVSANPILIAYDIETDDRAPWAGRSAAGVDIPSWTEWADWCEEDPGDGSARFEYNGILYERDIDRAQAEVLRHCHARIQIYNGKKYIIGDKPPPVMKQSDGTTDATWSGSSQTLTEDGPDGQASSEVRTGSLLWNADTDAVAVVTEVTDDDTVVTDTDVSSWSTVKVRFGSSVHLNTELWVGIPQGSDAEKQAAPDVVWVNYINSETWKSDRWEAVDPSIVPHTKDYIKAEATYHGCANASQAERHGQLQRRLMKFELNYWRNTYKGDAVRLFPGDICRGTFGDGTDEQTVRILSRVDYKDNTVALKVREFDPAAYSDDFASEDTPITISYPDTSEPPDPPASCTQEFGEHGDFDFLSRISDPHDLTATGGWTVESDANFVVTDEGTYTTIEVKEQLATFTISRDMTDELLGFGILHLSAILNWETNQSNGFRATVSYRAGPNSGAATTRLSRYIQPHSDLEQRFGFNFPIAAEAYHEIRFQFVQNLSVSPDWPEIAIRQLRIFSIATQGDEYVDNRHRTLQYYEKWTWVEGGSAEDNRSYQLWMGRAAPDILINDTPRDPDNTELKIFLGPDIVQISDDWANAGFSPFRVVTSTFPDPMTSSYMLATNPDGVAVAFPDPVQSSENILHSVTPIGTMELKSVAASDDKWWHLYDLPAYDDADNHQVVQVTLFGGNGPSAQVLDNFLIANDGEGTEAQVLWNRLTNGTEGVGLTIRRQGDKTDQIWVVAKSSVAGGYNSVFVEAKVLDYSAEVATIYAGVEDPTTIAPTDGSETFDSLTDDDPAVLLDGEDSSLDLHYTGLTTTTTKLRDVSATESVLSKTSATDSTLDVDLITGASGDALLRFFKNTTTSGAVSIEIYDGGGTKQHSVEGDTGDVDLCQQGGQLTVGGTGGTSKLNVVGSVSFPISTHTSDITLDATHYSVLLDGGSNTVTGSLPTAVGIKDRIYNLKCIDETFACELAADGSEEIDGSTDNISLSLMETVSVQSDGANWWIMP